MVQNQRELTQSKFWKLTTVLKHLDSSKNFEALIATDLKLVMNILTSLATRTRITELHPLPVWVWCGEREYYPQSKITHFIPCFKFGGSLLKI